MSEDIIKIATVSFNAKWGQPEVNLPRILGYIKAAASEGVNLIVFPETALTGYDDEADKPFREKMQYRVAESIPGPSSGKVAELTKQYGMYAVFGMVERDKDNADTLYNAAVVCGPNGYIGTYRKIHLPDPEPHWATRGEDPLLFDTPWGPIGVAICYDNYCFPEIERYYAAKGARLCINCTALPQRHGREVGSTTLEANVIQNQIYVVSSNLAGLDRDNVFWGGSSIIGPSTRHWEVDYYAGCKFTDQLAAVNKIYVATIDLTMANRALFVKNPLIGGATDFRPALYRRLADDLLKDPVYQTDPVYEE